MASRLLRQRGETPLARMLKFFSNLFRKPPSPQPLRPKTQVILAAMDPMASGLRPGAPTAVSARPMVAGVPVVKVETADLSLAAILARFPADLKETVAKLPDPSVLVTLPLSIILRQLSGGSVKMSLASVYRQAPPGTFSVAPRVEEKRMVEVPLGEIFKRVKPELLKRRADQRTNDLAEDEGQIGRAHV